MTSTSTGASGMRGTTVLAVRRGSNLVFAADGQVTLGHTVVKHGACKLRIMHEGKVLAGFAGSTADAFNLFERFEAKLKDYSGNLTRAAVELAKEWRTDKILRKLEAMLLIGDAERTLMLSGNGDVIDPDHGAVAIGSGGNFALSSSLALLEHTTLSPKEIATASMAIAGQLCIYTNTSIRYEELKNES